jgi:hypothetical protein
MKQGSVDGSVMLGHRSRCMKNIEISVHSMCNVSVIVMSVCNSQWVDGTELSMYNSCTLDDILMSVYSGHCEDKADMSVHSRYPVYWHCNVNTQQTMCYDKFAPVLN